ncbi:MAG: hypothetical protein HYW48_03565 [Deltaproteobacteria bacterium]|nr:hypothetical protein [Deltaproteobacteria bacterium]
MILADDPLPALFMSSYLLDSCLRKLKNVTLYVGLDLPFNFSTSCEEKKRLHLEATKSVLAPYSDKWGDCMAPRYFTGDCNYFSLFSILKERKLRGLELIKIRQVLESLKVDPRDVEEIWCRKGSLDGHFFYLCKNATGVSFEHGLPDIKNSLFEGVLRDQTRGRLGRVPKYIRQPVRRLKRFYFKSVDKIFLYFTANFETRFKKSLSLLGQEIKAGNPSNTKIELLSPSLLLDRTEEIGRNNHLFECSIPERSGLILTMFPYPKPWYEFSRNDVLKVFNAFEDYLLSELVPYFQSKGISTLVFKSKLFFDDYSDEGIARLDRLSKLFKIVYLSDLSKHNYPTEFYLPFLRPKILVAAYSTVLFFAKKMYPDIETLTYDQWFISLATRERYLQFREFSWYRKVFNDQFGHCFRDLLPTEKSGQISQVQEN